MLRGVRLEESGGVMDKVYRCIESVMVEEDLGYLLMSDRLFSIDFLYGEFIR